MLRLQAIGHLGRDASINQVNGKTVINFAVAHSHKFKDQNGAEINSTIWVDCAWWTDRTAVAQYLKKGTQVHIDGQPDIDTYKTRDGSQTKAKLKLRVDRLQLLGSKEETTPSPSDVPVQTSQPQMMTEDLHGEDDLPF